jgi:hypothetical protein
MARRADVCNLRSDYSILNTAPDGSAFVAPIKKPVIGSVRPAKAPWNHCHSSHVGGVVGSAAFQSDDVVNDVAGVGNDVSASPEGLSAPHFVFRISS